MMRKAMLICLTLCLTGITATAFAGDPWLHVRVVESGRHGEHVRVQVPLKMIKALLPLVETDEFHDGHIYLGRDHLEGADVRAILETLHEVEDGDFVRVDGRDESVRVAKRGGFLHVRVEEMDAWGDEEEVVRIKMPLAVVEAMLVADSDELDMIAAIEALERFGDMDLVTVDDGDSRVRVWIGERQDRLGDDDEL